MPSIDRVRRAVVAATLAGAGGVAFGTDAGDYLEQFAPLSGSVWEAATSELPDTVQSPYGDADVRYDDYGVPRVEAADEQALYFAVGYLHGSDRLFQLDLQRRQMRGTLSAVVGSATLDSDEFHRTMDFVGAAEATWEHVETTATGPMVTAYADGVNAAREDQSLPAEFELLDFEPAPWTPVDTLLMEKQIAWGLTGDFRTLDVATVADAFGPDVAGDLYPTRLDHDSPIIRDRAAKPSQSDSVEPADYRGLTEWLGDFQPDPGVGSNSWVVSGEHTESGAPIVANDPHLTLMAPPVWYQQDLVAADYRVRGVTFPGVPFVIIGENEAGAWGFTNVGADVLDVYEYETRDGEYRYGDAWRAFDERSATIEVADGDDVDVAVRKTVHGPVLEREGRRVGVAWTGLSATETVRSVHEMAQSDGVREFVAALRRFDSPTQNAVYADRDGNTLLAMTGRIPIRRVDGDPVRGDRIFDGSTGEGEWEGFTPYGTSSWEGFVPFEEKPGLRDPDVVATANQRVVDDPAHYIGQAYSPPFRGKRIYDRLDEATEAGSITPETMRDVQRDVRDERAAMLVPRLLSLREDVDDGQQYLDALADWNYEMRPDAIAATVFARWFAAYRETLYADAFDAKGLSADNYPNDWITVTLDADSAWFDVDGTPTDPESAMVAALESGEPQAYGEYNRLAIDHPFDQSFLNYPRIPIGGSSATVKNYRRDAAVGSSWRMVVPMDGDATVVLPGGNDGNPFSDHYDDQLRAWARGEYLPFDRALPEDPMIQFLGGSE
ncbi:MAG: penicillin acylase family protein [Halolamina sp.]